MDADRDYVLGTHDAEVERLALQHRIWRGRAADVWRRAGFTIGQTLLDVGCGPGHAAMDLAEIVGPAGRVVALDRSRRFLDALETQRARRGLANISVHEIDLSEAALPPVIADGAWCRWVFAFVRNPRHLLSRIHGALRPGGIFVAHEYLHYSTWRSAPRLAEHEELVRVVIESWRADGGEPDVGLDLPRWLEELGFEVRSLVPIVDVIDPSSFVWQWPKTFIDVGLSRLVDLERLTAERAAEIARALAAAEAAPHARMVTPTVLEIVAVRR